MLGNKLKLLSSFFNKTQNAIDKSNKYVLFNPSGTNENKYENKTPNLS